MHVSQKNENIWFLDRSETDEQEVAQVPKHTPSKCEDEYHLVHVHCLCPEREMLCELYEKRL